MHKKNSSSQLPKSIRVLLERFHESYRQDDVARRHQVYAREMEKRKGCSSSLRLSGAFRAFLREKDVFVREIDLLPGRAQYYDYRDSLPLLGFKPILADRGADEIFEIRQEIDNYIKRTPHIGEHESAVLNHMQMGADSGLYGRWNSGHLICGYERILQVGVSGILQECKLTKEAFSKEEDAQAMMECMEALQEYILRYEKAAELTAENTKDPLLREKIVRIKETCRRIAFHPPASFFDAVSLVALVHDAINCESKTGSLSIGRLDQWLYPFYQQDIESGALTAAEAEELIYALWLKFATLISGFQNVTLGGCDPQGNFVGNELSLMCLRASTVLHRDQPLVSFRWHQEMPEEFWEEIAALIGTGQGFPALFNDDVVMAAKIKTGVDEKEVWRYAIVGCVEPSIEGDEYANTEQLRVNWAMILAMMLDRHSYPVASYEQHDLKEIRSFEEFLAWYKRELIYFTEIAMEGCDLLDSTYGLEWPVPLLSALTKDGVQKGCDITRGSLKYSFSTINGCGMADAVDSLWLIRELVFGQKRMSLEELADMMKRNYQGVEGERLIAERLLGKFGNDNPITNSLMKELTDCFVNTITSRKNLYGNPFQAGLYTVAWHATLGEKTGALPSGRLSGVSLANALAPCQGADKEGPTAVIGSVTEVDMSGLGNGMVLDLKFTPSFFEKKECQESLRDLINGYFASGGMEIQFNVVDKKTLLAAKKEPEKYKDLIVRVSGFSAYFTLLDPTLQDEIIARTEYSRI